jgi:hypothetical protein
MRKKVFAYFQAQKTSGVELLLDKIWSKYPL